MRLRRILVWVGVLALAWLAALALLGTLLGGGYGARIAERMGETLQGTSTVDRSDLALVRGALAIDQLRVRRDDAVGTLALDVGEVRCDLPPMGIALFDRECRELVIAGVRLEVSSFALFDVKRPRRPPIRARRVAIADAVFGLATTLGRVEVKLDHLRSGPTTFRTPLSWLFSLESLHATVELPLGAIEIGYANGVLVVAGVIVGTQVIALELPAADPADDAPAELARLVAWARATIKRVVGADR